MTPTGRSSIPWRQTFGHHYITTELARVDGYEEPKGFKFQVSIPLALQFVPLFRAIIHDPEWLWCARNHDLRLKHMSAARAAFRFRADLKDRLTRRRWLIPPAFLGVLIWTTTTRFFRRVFSCLKGQDL